VTSDDAPPPALPNVSPARDREPWPLTHRERQIVALVMQGFGDKEMAKQLFISVRTLKKHLCDIFDILGVSNRFELVVRMWDGGLADGPCVIAEGGRPRLPHRPPLSASAEPPVD
jgi:DNA-binding CsgD family transcriptional regulator